MKKTALFVFLSLLFMVSACSNDDITPQERFEKYVNHWNNQEFSQMYDMLTSQAAETYPTEDFVDRYQTIYNDLTISDLNITFEDLSEDQMETAMEKGTAQFPFTVEMESSAGPITFDYKATLIREEVSSSEETEENWFVKWDPGFIFPEIKDGGEIALEISEPKRGEILDRNRMPLAINDNVQEVGVVPEDLGENPEETIQKIADLAGMSTEEIDGVLNQDWVQPNMFVPLTKLPPSEEAAINQLSELDGVTFSDATGRVYPLGEAAAHLTGYVSQVTAEDLEELDQDTYDADDMMGQRGLESLFEERLKGEEGATITAVSEDGEETVIAEKEAENGGTSSQPLMLTCRKLYMRPMMVIPEQRQPSIQKQAKHWP
ncbi:NTF2-like N-terminal transpeptidase domain-containing protein [Lentibacillus amyloliquefaciens]|uniref:NTF2-like N-terminal transpeptidase domain-containing protein n=1 Tax=Lentibacillus amyloliquefaciens TaxID=1472767 RepID=UPI001F247CEE|nr:NTF2-like N-terminal transpeptidase domain-containing protein [Lentibacillus amyloliquefaciens]